MGKLAVKTTKFWGGWGKMTCTHLSGRVDTVLYYGWDADAVLYGVLTGALPDKADGYVIMPEGAGDITIPFPGDPLKETTVKLIINAKPGDKIWVLCK